MKHTLSPLFAIALFGGVAQLGAKVDAGTDVMTTT